MGAAQSREGRPKLKTDWRLSYDDDGVNPGADFHFGTPSSGYVFQRMPVIDAPEIRNDDTSVYRDDGAMFGRDFRGGTTIGFEMTANAYTEAEGRELASILGRVWRADAVRSVPGKVATLTAATGRSAFGRPRRLAAIDDKSHRGMQQVALDFVTGDDLWYDDEQEARVALVPPPQGGLVAPLTAPLTTQRSADRSRAFTVGGKIATWGVFEIEGPIARPSLELLGRFRLEYDLTLLYDQVLTIDTRPWARTVNLYTAGIKAGSRAGAATRLSTLLSQTQIPPGSHEFVLRGTSTTGTPTAAVRWRNAHPNW